MASPIIGTLYVGLFAGGVSTGLPVENVSIHQAAAVQCVECVSTNRLSVRRHGERFVIEARTWRRDRQQHELLRDRERLFDNSPTLLAGN